MLFIQVLTQFVLTPKLGNLKAINQECLKTPYYFLNKNLNSLHDK